MWQAGLQDRKAEKRGKILIYNFLGTFSTKSALEWIRMLCGLCWLGFKANKDHIEKDQVQGR